MNKAYKYVKTYPDQSKPTGRRAESHCGNCDVVIGRFDTICPNCGYEVLICPPPKTWERPVTPQMVKELREATGAGMRECLRYLTLAFGDMEIAKELCKISSYAIITRDAKGNIVDNIEHRAKMLVAQKEADNE